MDDALYSDDNLVIAGTRHADRASLWQRPRSAWSAYAVEFVGGRAAAPTGCGKTGVMELALVRTLLSGNGAKALYLAPTKVRRLELPSSQGCRFLTVPRCVRGGVRPWRQSLCVERHADWEARLEPLQLKVALLTSDADTDIQALQHRDVMCVARRHADGVAVPSADLPPHHKKMPVRADSVATPEKWDALTRRW